MIHWEHFTKLKWIRNNMTIIRNSTTNVSLLVLSCRVQKYKGHLMSAGVFPLSSPLRHAASPPNCKIASNKRTNSHKQMTAKYERKLGHRPILKFVSSAFNIDFWLFLPVFQVLIYTNSLPCKRDSREESDVFLPITHACHCKVCLSYAICNRYICSFYLQFLKIVNINICSYKS